MTSDNSQSQLSDQEIVVPSRAMSVLRTLSPAIVSHALLLLIWYLAAAFADIPAFILPSPTATVQTLFQDSYAWGLNTYVTAAEILVGYVIAVIFGIGMAMFFYWFRWLSILLFPVFVTLSMVPKVALGPLFVVWFSYGMGTNIFIAFVISFFPILLTTWRGLREVEPELLELVNALKASRWQIFIKILLPNSLPYIFSGMKVGSILAVAGAIVGEFIASENGLGYLMIQVQAVLDTAAMFMAVILLSILGVSLYLGIILLERFLVVQDARID